MKVTTDTNVLVSATFWTGDSYKILDMIDKGEVELVLSDDIIKEYTDVVNRDEIMKKVENKGLIISKIVDSAITNATLVEPVEKLDVVKEDINDNIIIECAIEGKVDYIVTQDEHLLDLKEFEGIKIVTPEEMMKILDRSL